MRGTRPQAAAAGPPGPASGPGSELRSLGFPGSQACPLGLLVSPAGTLSASGGTLLRSEGAGGARVMNSSAVRSGAIVIGERRHMPGGGTPQCLRGTLQTSSSVPPTIKQCFPMN